MFKVVADKNKNRLYITMIGVFDKKSGADIISAIVREVNKLQKDFDVINDLSQYKYGSSDAADILVNALSFLKTRGVRRVVRVVGSSKAGLVQFAHYTKKIADYTVTYVPTLKDAEKELNRI